ncbi:MAG: non-ribosomal peptide synthetase [Acidimicrobiales bacterium]
MSRPGGAAPISVAQEAMWYLSLLYPDQISYNESISIRKDGPLDLDALRRAFNEIVRRHEAWRTRYDVVGGRPIQIIEAPPCFELPVLDLSRLDPADAERHAVRVITEVARVPYDLRRGPLMRPRLLRFPGAQHRLYLPMHHLIFDGVSVYRVVLPELVELYDAYTKGEESPLPNSETTYKEYARWEQEWMESARVARRMNYWRDRLSDAPRMALPLDRRRPATPRFRGALVPLEIPGATTRALREIGQPIGATLFQVLATAWAVLLGWCSGQEDVVFSTAADLRQRPEFEAVVGCSLTPLVLRVDLSGDPSFSELVVRVRNELLDGLDNVVPFERIVRELGPDTAAGANPVYDTMIVLEPPVISPDPAWSVHQIESAIGQAVGNAKLDLELGLDERPSGEIEGRLIYDSDLFEAETASRFVDQWLGVLRAVAADPSLRVSGLMVPRRNDVRRLGEWNETTTVGRPALLQELIEAQADRTPDAPAVADGTHELSYRQLVERAERTALRLGAAGIGPGAVIAFCTEPTAELIASLLGVLKAGAAYLLLDPGLDPELLDQMVADCSASAVYAAPELAARLANQTAPILAPAESAPGGSDPVPGGVGASPESLCCVQYLGGGSPRGVPMRHDSVVNVVEALATELGLGPADTAVLLPATLFRAAAIEPWIALTVGAKVRLVSEPAASDGAALSKLISAERASFLHADPGTWQHLIETGLRGARGLVALCGGGELDPALAEAIGERARVLFSAFGALETTVYATLSLVDPGRPVAIGRPVANLRAHVVDRGGQPVPPGVTGLLVLAGLGVAGGYLDGVTHRTDRFLSEPGGGGPAFATGQLARWRASGELELVALHRPEVAHS